MIKTNGKEFTMLAGKIRKTARGLKAERMEIINLALVYRTLSDNKFNRSKTADSLGVSVKTVRAWIRKLKKWGINIPDFKRELYGVRKPKKYCRLKEDDSNAGVNRTWVGYETKEIEND